MKMKQLRQRDRALNQEVKLSQVNVALKKKELALDQRRVELLEKKAKLADETEATVRDADLTDEERAQKIKEIYGRA